jgi:positive regulator of sigma E activity
MLRILELSWLVIVLLGASLGTYKFLTENISSAIWFFMFTGVALVFWLVRRRQRIRLQKRGKVS